MYWDSLLSINAMSSLVKIIPYMSFPILTAYYLGSIGLLPSRPARRLSRLAIGVDLALYLADVILIWLQTSFRYSS